MCETAGKLLNPGKIWLMVASRIPSTGQAARRNFEPVHFPRHPAVTYRYGKL